MKKKYFLLNRPIPPELCHQEEILVQGQKGGVVKTVEYNLTFPPPPSGWGKRNQLREENSKFIRNGRGKKERKRRKMEEEKGKREKKKEKRKKVKEKWREKEVKKSSKKNSPATHTCLLEENSIQKNFLGGKKSNFRKNILPWNKTE